MHRHVLVLGDQLTRVVGPLAGADPAITTVLLIESDSWARRRRDEAAREAIRVRAAEVRAMADAGTL